MPQPPTLVDPSQSGAAPRRRIAELAAAADRIARASGVPNAPFSLAFLTDRKRVPTPDAIVRPMPRGTAAILRDYDAPRRAALAARLVAICRRRGVLFLVAGDAELARAVGADGVHLSARSSRPPLSRTPGLLTVSCHDREEMSRAAAWGADAVFLSPIFPTLSHPGAAVLGPAGFRALAAAQKTPVLALGGVDAGNAGSLAGRNIVGFGAIGAFAG